MLRQVTNHIKKLQEELQAESSTNIEFEESSRRSFEFLAQQLKALKQAFNTLSDTLLEELEHISHTVTSELTTLKSDPRTPHLEKQQEAFKDQISEFSNDTFDKLKRLAEQDCYLESKIDQLNQDMDTVLQVIPKMEDSFLKGDSQLQDRQSNLGIEISKLNDIMAVERCKNNSAFDRLEGRIKEQNLEFDEKILRCQKSLQQQMEYVSRLVITRGVSAPVGFDEGVGARIDDPSPSMLKMSGKPTGSSLRPASPLRTGGLTGGGGANLNNPYYPPASEGVPSPGAAGGLSSKVGVSASAKFSMSK